MTKFYKATNLRHPKSHLPTVLWGKNERPLFEFTRGPLGLLELDTDDQGVIDLLREMGYDEEAGPEMLSSPQPAKAASTAADPVPDPGHPDMAIITDAVATPVKAKTKK